VRRRSARAIGAAAAAAAVALTATAALLPATASARDKWDTRVLAVVPKPGYPAHPYVDPKGQIWEGTYVNMLGDALQSRVFEFGADGALLRNFTIPGQDLSAEHGIQVATSDAKGRLVLLDRTPSRALILDPETARITEYARFRELPPCGSAPTGAECSATRGDEAVFANYAAWGPDGSLYVTDYHQATIWKVPPGGGTPTVWLTHPLLDGGGFGTAGIWLLPDHRTFLISQALSISGGSLTNGYLFKLPINDDGSPGAITKLWESDPVDLPDGFAVAKSGTIYLANVGLTAQLAQIAPDGTEVARFPQTPLTGDNGSAIPFDSPSGVVFRGTSLIVANQSAILGNIANQALLDVEAGEEGQPEFIPPNAGPVDVVGRSDGGTKLTARVTRRRGRALTLTLSRGVRGTPARVRLTAHGRTVATGTLRGRTLRVTLRGTRLGKRVTLRGVKLHAQALTLR
jgi:sugar lactone lactonase YvrE